MRLDKFLKVSRMIKRRSVASSAAKSDKVLVNGKVAKPSTEVKVGDIIQICYANRTVEVKVVQLLASTKKEDANDMYEMINVSEK
ncbi:MAG: RNA-binding S4 domain-containing protein [Bacilli bacterium]|jgi:ribosomal 50S subunit-recycling heat shock protein|nr:RNA-binding S4 domain-containing protein [Bacilli bacterium]MDY0064519.1 RNA-binding S4 domain-containing protein [Bacilli bacterium]